MRVPVERVEVSSEKTTEYLLIKKDKNDKSGFLLDLGYSLDRWRELETDIIKTVSENEVYLQRESAFDSLYEVKGALRNYGVVTTWLLTIDGEKFKFVTLFPDK